MDPLRQLARRHARRRALVDRSAGFWATWFDLDGLAQAWARRFEDAGLRAGERVAVVEPAGIRFASLLHACLRTGAAIVPLSPRGPEAEIERALADCRPRLLVRDGNLEAMPGPPAVGPPGDACVLYTSGTTGEPKGVRLTLANHLASARGCRQGLGAGFDDRWLLMLSPHHVGGLAILLRSVLCNQPVITVSRFEEGAVLEALAAERPTLVSAVPTMLTRLLAAGGPEPLRALRAILVGGAPVPAEQAREWAGLGLRACPSYGLTETCSQVAIVPPGRIEELAGASGLVGPQASVEITADSEIVVSGPCVSPGYVNPAIAPAPARGRFPTGDEGRLEDGVLTVLGRRDDTIITGGENVRPEEVEAVLRAHPAVADAAVAGQADPTWGQVAAAFVVSPDATEEELEAWCRARLSPFKVPRRWTFVERLPRSEGGKLLRAALRRSGA